MADIIDEIKDDIEQERLLRLWQRYGQFLVYGAVALVLAVAIYVFVQQKHLAKLQGYGDALYEATAYDIAGNHVPAEAIYRRLYEEGNATYRSIAGLKLGALLWQKNKKAEALTLWKDVAGTSSAPKEFSDLASLYVLYYDQDLSPDAGQVIINELTQEGRPWRHLALEYKAVSALGSDQEQAKAALEKALNDPEGVAPKIQSRLQELQQLINQNN